MAIPWNIQTTKSSLQTISRSLIGNWWLNQNPESSRKINGTGFWKWSLQVDSFSSMVFLFGVTVGGALGEGGIQSSIICTVWRDLTFYGSVHCNNGNFIGRAVSWSTSTPVLFPTLHLPSSKNVWWWCDMMWGSQSQKFWWSDVPLSFGKRLVLTTLLTSQFHILFWMEC